MYRSSPLRSTLNTGYITGLDMCKVCTEAVHCAAPWTCVQVQKNVIIPTPPHPTPPYPMWCVRGWLRVEKMMQNCACVYLWLQSVCAGDSGKWLCAHVTPVCVRGWLWVEKWCKIVPACTCDPECVRGWPPDLQIMAVFHADVLECLLSKADDIHTETEIMPLGWISWHLTLSVSFSL